MGTYELDLPSHPSPVGSPMIVIAAGLAMWRWRNDTRSLQVRVDDAAVLIGRADGGTPLPWGQVAACDVVEVRDHGRALVVMDDAAAHRTGGVATMTAVLARVAALTGWGPAGARVVWLDTLPDADTLLAVIGESSGGRWPVAGAELTT